MMLSVVIPMFNVEDVVEEQLAALATQHFNGPWEVIAVDNRSTDGTLARVLPWQERLPLRAVDAHGRQGVSYARNVGATAARGDFLLFLDADDVVAPGWLGAMARGAADDDFICSQLEPFIVREGQRHIFPRRGFFLTEGFLHWSYGGTLGIRKDVLQRTGAFAEDWHYAEDVEFCWRVQLSGTPLRYVPGAVVGYREPPRLAALARQRFLFGFHTPRLRRRFAAAGLPRRSLRSVVRDLVWIASRVPTLALSSYRRREWIGMTFGEFGRLSGMWKWRAFDP